MISTRTLSAAFLLFTMAVMTASCDADDPFVDDRIVWTDLTVGDDHACAEDDSANIYCWGANDRGQLSIPASNFVPAPTLSLIATDAEALVAGDGVSCKVAGTGRMTCWGDGTVGQFANGTPFTSNLGVDVGGGPWSEVSAGLRHLCGRNAGVLQCWGGNVYSAALGADLPVQSRCTFVIEAGSEGIAWCALTPQTIQPGGLRDVSVGASHACALDSAGGVWCWGSGQTGRLGFAPADQCRFIDPVHGDSFTPCAFEAGQVALPEPARLVRAGSSFSCALGESGAAYCWGSTAVYVGQLGSGDTQGSEMPVRVSTTESFEDLSLSRTSGNGCGLTQDGRALCWGPNLDSALGATGPDACQIGTLEVDCAFAPVPVDTEARFVRLGLGARFMCGLTAEGQILCWGRGDLGQLGDGTTANRVQPAPIRSIR